MRWLLRFFLSDADRRAIDADLAELHALRRQWDGERSAARWLKRQHRLYTLHLLRDRWRAVTTDRMTTMPHLWRDFSYSLRSLARTRTLAATIIITVGVGLGATTGMISIIRAVLLNPLPYASPDEIVWVYTDNPPFRFRFSLVDFRALEADHAALAGVAGYQTSSVTVAQGDVAENVTAKAVSGSYFPLMRQTPLLGRLFSPTDDTSGDRLAILTADYWSRRFGRDPSIVGRTVTINGVSHSVVGVLEPSAGPLENGVAVFTAARWAPPQRKGPFFMMVLARLRPDVSREAAAEALRATNARLFPIWKSSYQDEKATWNILDLKDRAVGDVGTTLWLVLAAVACVLLIACANAMNLLIARALSRSRELAVRSALGATRGRLVQHLIVEGGVLAAAAAGVGFGVALLIIRLVRAYGSDYIPRVAEVRLSGPVLGWLVVLAVISGVLLCLGGLLPGIRGSRSRVDQALRSGSRSTTDGPAARRLRHVLIVAEFALATPLIVAAGLVMGSLDRLGRVDIGMDLEQVLTAQVSLPGSRYAEDADRETFWDRALEKVAALPGVTAVALANSRPPQEAFDTNNFDLEDRPTPAGQNQPLSTWVAASPGFFKTVGLTLQRGRLLDDRSLDENVIVVDRAWANRFFPGEEILGRRLKNGGCTECPWTTVVGVVSTVKYTGLDAQDEGTVYYPLVNLSTAYFLIRTAGEPSSLTTALVKTVRDLDSSLAVADVATGNELVATALAAPRYLSILVGVFALSALILSVVGIYGVMAYFVQQHTRDIGVRLALGGEPSAVGRMVVFRGLRLVVAGVVIGVGGAILANRLLTNLLFGASPTEWRVLVGVPVVLLAIASIACMVPGRRAARLDPADILRES